MADPVASSPAPRSNTLLLAVLLGAGGFVAYRYWYVPYKFRRDLEMRAAAAGQAPRDYLRSIGSAACQAYGASQGIPPQVTGGVCNELSAAAADVVRNLPEILSGAGKGAGSALTSIGQGGGAGVLALGKGFVDANLYPVERGGTLLKEGAASIYGGTKTVVQDVVGGIKSVANTLNPINLGKSLLGIGGGINCSVPQSPENAAWCRGRFGMASAPGSDAWARANGRQILVTGAGST